MSKKFKETVGSQVLEFNESEMIGVKFNMLDNRDKSKWIHAKTRGKAATYIKDLILLDMMFDLLGDGDPLKKLVEIQAMKLKEEGK